MGDLDFNINDLPGDLQELYINYLIIEIINTREVNQDNVHIDKDILDKFSKAYLDSTNIYVDVPIYTSLFTMILYQKYNIDINSATYDRIVNSLLVILKSH